MIQPPRHATFADDRGTITDLLTNVKLDSVTRIYTVKGAVRGNHYHGETKQWTLILDGALRVVTRADETTTEDIAIAGDLFLSPPNEYHAWEALENTTVLVFTEGPRSGANYESDTFRLSAEDRLI